MKKNIQLSSVVRTAGASVGTNSDVEITKNLILDGMEVIKQPSHQATKYEFISVFEEMSRIRELKALDLVWNIHKYPEIEDGIMTVLKNSSISGFLPLTFLGGAARDYFNDTYWRLRDLIPNDLLTFDDPSAITSIPSLFETFPTGNKGEAERTFFISYARARPYEADYVEALFRRRNHIVYRDEENFEPSANTQTEIIKNIKRADVFVALWCQEYACSPWCFDELEVALERHSKGLADLWIFCIDDTRIVPKAARSLNYYPVNSREKLEGKILFLLNKFEEREA